MRNTKVWAISLPPLFAEKAEQLAKKEQRNKSELVREALRQYITVREWEELQSRAVARAAELGIRDEGDVVDLVDQVREER